MFKYLVTLLSVFTVSTQAIVHNKNEVSLLHGNILSSGPVNNGCVSFSIGPGTGCTWMCNYCASQLGTTNYYFTNGVCTYQSGGCVGNPMAGVSYTCCSV
jgi:hypothetical protein